MKEKITAGYSMRRTETLSVLFLVSSVRMSAQSASPQKPPQPTGDTVTVMLPGTPTPPRQDTTAPEGKPEWKRAGETVPSVGASETRKPSAPASLGGEIASVQEQIRSAEEDDSRYSGGLVKSLIGARIAILKQTEAMLRQASTPPRQAMDASTLNRLRSVEKEASDNLKGSSRDTLSYGLRWSGRWRAPWPRLEQAGKPFQSSSVRPIVKRKPNLRQGRDYEAGAI
jgi:hypothetical protein